MKKVLFFMMVLAILVTSCSKDKSKSLDYYDGNPIEMVLQGEHTINVSSDYDISFTAINEGVEVITVDGNGKLFGKNVGNAKVWISNGYEGKTVDVVVSLFREPTFEFGCNSERIRQLYGAPYYSAYVQDTLLVYQYTNQTAYGFYSAACYQMLFYFYNQHYIESDLYIRKDYNNPLLINYLDENFDYFFTIPNYYYDNNITHDSVPATIYKSKFNENVRCGRFEHSNTYDDICLFYYTVTDDAKNERENSLNRVPRSSKFLY